jgi:hypothetical protein
MKSHGKKQKATNRLKIFTALEKTSNIAEKI